jgi:hypothetical protein
VVIIFAFLDLEKNISFSDSLLADANFVERAVYAALRFPYVEMVGLQFIDFHILNFTALSVVGVLQYSLLPLAL